MENNKKQTAVDSIIDYIEKQQNSYVSMLKSTLKGKTKEVDAILTATTLIMIECKKAKEMEKEQIIDAFLDDLTPSKQNIKEAEQYYKETYERTI